MRGQKTEGYIHLADWYATLYGLAGVDPTDEEAAKAKLPPIDSLDLIRAFLPLRKKILYYTTCCL